MNLWTENCSARGDINFPRLKNIILFFVSVFESSYLEWDHQRNIVQLSTPAFDVSICFSFYLYRGLVISNNDYYNNNNDNNDNNDMIMI